MWSIGQQFDATGRRPSGFDYLRICLSVLIVVWHTIYVCYDASAEEWFWTGPLRPFPYVLVPSFFALSGFLIAGSVLRNDLPSFLTLRVIRIVPALFCEVVISAFIIGPLLTAVSWGDYFGSPVLWAYLQNILGFIHYELPGVFLNNNTPAVNLQLWTIPHELHCYIAITILAVLGLVRRPALFALMLGAMIAGFYLNATFRTFYPGLFARPEGKILVMSFLAGILLFIARDRIPCNRPLALLAALATWVSASFIETSYFSVLPIAYLTVWLGLQNPRKLLVVAGADYSYGVYLYGFPIQQALYQLGLRDWYTNLPASLLLSFLAAYLSWTYVEAKVMDQRKPILAGVSRVSAAVRRVPVIRWIVGLPPVRLAKRFAEAPAR